jgi:hypothetical protein
LHTRYSENIEHQSGPTIALIPDERAGAVMSPLNMRTALAEQQAISISEIA